MGVDEPGGDDVVGDVDDFCALRDGGGEIHSDVCDTVVDDQEGTTADDIKFVLPVVVGDDGSALEEDGGGLLGRRCCLYNV